MMNRLGRLLQVMAPIGWWSLCLVISGCAMLGEAPPPHSAPANEQALLKQVLGTESDREEPVDLLAIDDRVRQLVAGEINPAWNPERKLVALRALLFDKDRLNIHYDGMETRTAMETFRTGQGNCLSMTSLFVAIARYAGLDAHYQVVSVKPTWELNEEVMIRNDHVNATGFLKSDRRYVVDFLPEIYLGEPDSHVISDRQARALYYNNLGAEQIIRGDLDSALRQLRTALAIEPDLSEVWNNMGAAMSRSGESQLSEISYLRAAALDLTNMTARSNLARFYRSQGDTERADYYAEKVARFRARNPYYLYFEARRAFKSGDYRGTVRLLKRAIHFKPDDPDFYTALASTYEALGAERKSRKYKERAEAVTSMLRSGNQLPQVDVQIEGQAGAMHQRYGEIWIRTR